MTDKSIDQIMRLAPVIPVIVIDRVEDAVPMAEALVAGGYTLEERRVLAAQAFQHTASYDTAVASWLTGQTAAADEAFPAWLGRDWELVGTLRYGENKIGRAHV